nr:reverse transcriptase domain-containing protein [Tanacetum cinerariifolium]
SDDGVTTSLQLSRNSRPPMLDHQDKYMMKAQVHVSKSSTISDEQPLPRRKHYCQIYQVVKHILRGRLLASFQDLEHEGGDTRSQVKGVGKVGISQGEAPTLPTKGIPLPVDPDAFSTTGVNLFKAYENSLIYKERTKKLYDDKIKNCIFNVGDQVLLFNSILKIFSDGCNFKVNCHRLKHYHGGDPPPLEIPDVTTFPKDK